jgi:hypothetical protein
VRDFELIDKALLRWIEMYFPGEPMKLFYAPGSSSLFPHIVLHEAGLPFTAKIDEHTKVIEGGGDYRQVNPLGYFLGPARSLDKTA